MSFKPYPKYNESGVEWLGRVPEHWAIAPLKAVASCNDDVLPEDTPPDQEITYVDISGVEAGRGIISSDTMTFSTAPSRARRRVRHGDVIVSTVRTYLRAIAPITDPEDNLIVSTGFAVIRPVKRLSTGYAGYLLSAGYFIEQVIARSTGVSYPAINASDLVAIHTTVPPLDEQAAIAAFLDHETAKIDALIAEQQRLIELLQEKRQAVISHAVTKGLNPDAPMKDSRIEWLGEVPEHWHVVKLGHLLAEPPRNGLSPEITPSGTTPTFSIAAVRSGRVDIEPHLKYCDVSVDKATPYFVAQGDVLVLRGSGSKDLVGTAGVVVAPPPINCIYPDILIRLRPSGRVTRWYLVQTLNCPVVRPQVVVAAQTAAGIWKLAGSELREIRMPVPPLEEQHEIEASVLKEAGATADLIAAAEASLNLLQERRSALISAAVTGQIDVRDFAPDGGSEAA